MSKHNDLCLGLDVGGSATRWCLLDAGGSVVARGEAVGFSGHLLQADVHAKAVRALDTICALTGPVSRITAGVTGLSRSTEQSRLLHGLMQERFGTSQIALMPDIALACQAAFPVDPGILVYAGTGSIAATRESDGSLLTAGGKGVVIDDAGGGYWIAVTAMRRVLRLEDMESGSGWKTLLGTALVNALETPRGSAEWPAVRQAFYALDRGGVARLAMAVGLAAEQGDAEALHILKSAGAELAGFAAMLLSRVGQRPVILSGRATALHPSIADSMENTLRKTGFVSQFSCISLDQALSAAQCCLAESFHSLMD
ncbi:MAG: N-acetylglucosamine kinase [Beijerinckiaceae bacterium]